MQSGDQVGEGDAGAGYIHINNRHKHFLQSKGYANTSEAVYDILDNADFVVKSTSSDGCDRVAFVKDLAPHTSVLLALDYTEEKGEGYYTVVSILPRSKKQLRDKKTKALSFDGSVRPSSATGSGAFFTPTGIKAGTKGDSIAGKDNTFDTVSLADVDKYVNEYTYDQKAYHGTGAVFDKFVLGYLGAGTGDAIHGWGLYFAKNKRTAESYKQAIGSREGAEASLYEVDVPDNKYLLDEQKSFGEQMKGIQKNIVKAIKGLSDEQAKLFWIVCQVKCVSFFRIKLPYVFIMLIN